MRTALTIIAILALLVGSPAGGADGEKDAKPRAPGRKPAEPPAPEIDPALEADALTFVRDQHPELAKVLEALKPMNLAEYRKAIAELSEVARAMTELKRKNPRRHEVILASWRAKSRVELVAAQLAGSPSEELRSQLRTAIEARIDAEIARRRFDLEQAEAAAKKAREALDLLENHRDTAIESRFRALQPKKPAKAKKPAPTTKPAEKPAKPLTPTNPPGEDR